ncbi:hypothetical protein MRX96_042124 [Rhipicephalus microplus]
MRPTRGKANAALFSVIEQGCCLYRRRDDGFEFALKESEQQCKVWANVHAVNRGDAPMFMQFYNVIGGSCRGSLYKCNTGCSTNATQDASPANSTAGIPDTDATSAPNVASYS